VQVERPRGGCPLTRLLSHRPVLCAEELLILLVNFMKIKRKMKSEQAVLPNPCLEEEDYELFKSFANFRKRKKKNTCLPYLPLKAGIINNL
jgi:hypothetical protein